MTETKKMPTGMCPHCKNRATPIAVRIRGNSEGRVEMECPSCRSGSSPQEWETQTSLGMNKPVRFPRTIAEAGGIEQTA